MKEKINPTIQDQINRKQHYLANNSVIPTLLNKEFIQHFTEKQFLTSVLFLKRTFNLTDVNPNVYKSLIDQYKSVIEEIEQHERTLLPQLEKLAVNVVKDYFDLTDDFLFEIKIQDNNSTDLYGDPTNQDDEDFANYLEILKKTKQIDRNRFNYAFIIGAANECTNNIYNYIYEVDNLNPKLSDAYRKYIALNNYNVWVTPDNILEKKYNNKKYFYILDVGYGTQIEIYAPNFIIALNQAFLAIFAVLTNTEFNSQEVSYSSPWNIRLGMIFWSLFKKNFRDTKNLKFFLKEVAKLSDDHYYFFFREVLASTKLSKDICNKMNINYDKTYN